MQNFNTFKLICLTLKPYFKILYIFNINNNNYNELPNKNLLQNFLAIKLTSTSRKKINVNQVIIDS